MLPPSSLSPPPSSLCPSLPNGRRQENTLRFLVQMQAYLSVPATILVSAIGSISLLLRVTSFNPEI